MQKIKRFSEKYLRINCTNKCNVPKKKIIALSNSKFSQDIVIFYEKTDESFIEDNEWQRVTTNDNEWQQMTGTTNENDKVHFKEWVNVFLWQKQTHYF